MTIGIAILGAGVFATDEHLPAIQKNPDYVLRAVYSRSKQSAEKLATAAGPHVEAYYDVPSTPDRDLDALLKRSDINSVSIAVSIAGSPNLIRKALRTGKNVLSEKPIAPTKAIAQDLLEEFGDLQQKRASLWGVGENFRFWRSVNRAAGMIKDLDCNILTFKCNINHFINADNKFFASEWRQLGTHPAGFVLDACIHFVAILRYLLAANGKTISQVSALTKLIDPALPPIDTVLALVSTSSGISGTFHFSVGISTLDGIDYEIVTDKGNIRVQGPDTVLTVLRDKDKKLVENELKDEFTFGVVEEFAAFSSALKGGEMDSRITPKEALADLQLLEAMLISGEKHGAPVAV